MSQDRFNNPKYIDWVKVKLSLQYAKEGLEPSTDQKVQTFHHNLSSTLQAPSSSSASPAPTLCHGCLKTDLKRQWSRQRFSCLGGICDGWLDLIQKNHVDPTTSGVEWDNFDVSWLPTSPWECAKVYMPYGSGRVNCAGDADLAAILTLFLNCRHFASSLQNVNLCEKVKEVRNRLIHSGTMELERPQMLSDVRVIKELLGDQAFSTDTACQEAITKIDKLVTDKLELSQNKELELVVLNGDIKSVADKTGQLRHDIDDLTSQVQRQHSQLTTEVRGVTTEVASLKSQLRTEVSDVTTEVASLKTQLRTEVSDVTTEVASLKNQLTTEVSNVTTEVASLKTQLRTEVSDVTTEVASLKNQLTTEVSNVTTEVASLKTQLRTEVSDVATEVSSMKTQLGTEVSGLKKQLTTEISGVATEVSSLRDQLKTRASGVDTKMTSLNDKLNVSMKDIVELQKVADILCRFINACQIDKVDMGQLAASISTLSALRAETDRQGQILAQLQETVGRHEVTLEQHGGTLEQHGGTLAQHRGTLEQHGGTLEQHGGTLEQHGGTLEQHERKLNILEAKRGRSDRQNPEVADIAALQQHLIAVYTHDCKWENPVTTDQEKPLTISQMYVEPQINLVRQRNQKDYLVEVEQRQQEKASKKLTYKQILYTDEEQCQNIYVTGNAGMGKTMFCRQVVNTWCKAVQNISEDGDSVEDLSVLKEFMLLFYLNLREAESLYHVEEMIRENILHDAPTEYNVSDILKTEKCLVVLDGLDEWSCPQGARICRGLNKDIPGRNIMNKNCAYLTTTRNWKFDVIDLKSKDCDKQVELCGIGEKSSWELAEKTVCKLSPKSQHERPIYYFFQEVEEKNLYTLTTVPVLLIQLLTLWYFCKDLGKSQVQLYCRMLDILLEQAKKHLSEKSSTVTKPVQTDTELPRCFSEEEDNCCNHTQLLLCLSKLAFMSLLNKKKEDSLVFKSSRLEVCGIGSSDIGLCLKCGIFTQNKVLCNPIGRYKKYSFIHKKLQEFLAAVYLVTSCDVEDNMKQVREYCDKLDTTLEMSQMIMFVCGMNAEVGNQLLEHLKDAVEGDNSVQNYRQSLVGRRLINEIQTSVMAFVTEGASNGLKIDVHLQDYYIDSDTISDYVLHVVEKKNTSIKSVYIKTWKCSKEHVTVVLKHLQKVQTLEKLWLRDPWRDVSDSSILAPVLTTNVSTLQSLCLGGVDLARDQALFTAVLGCVPSLRALELGSDGEKWLRGMVVSHGQIEQLLAATSHLTHLSLNLDCTDHRRQCRPVLDLSHHTQLQTLNLWHMGVTNLHAVEHSVETVDLWDITVAHSTLRQFIEALAQSSNKVQVELYYITVTEDSGEATDTLAYIRDCDKFTVERCDILSDKRWLVKFHKK